MVFCIQKSKQPTERHVDGCGVECGSDEDPEVLQYIGHEFCGSVVRIGSRRVA